MHAWYAQQINSWSKYMDLTNINSRRDYLESTKIDLTDQSTVYCLLIVCFYPNAEIINTTTGENYYIRGLLCASMHPSVSIYLSLTGLNGPKDRVQPKTPPFSTRNLIWVNYKVVSPLSQPILLSFLYLNSARHNLVIILCRALKIF